MSRFVRMPWDDRIERWSQDEIRLALQLDGAGLNRAEVADRLAEAGFPPRDETNVDHKLREVRAA